MTGTLPPLVARDALTGDAPDVAPRLLGLLLVTPEVTLRIVEVEAYRQDDPASHSHRGPTAANASMFGPPGHLYVYVSHGIHRCGNVVVGPVGQADAVLLRGGVVVAGRDAAVERRGGRTRDRELAAGPGRLGQVLAFARADDGLDLLAPDSSVTLRDDGWRPDHADVRVGPRTGVRLAAEVPWRWWVRDSEGVSPYRRHPQAATTGR